jgi:hypothetical protein
MECPACRLINPRGSSRCDCGYDFTKPVGSYPHHFASRYRGALLGGVFILVLGLVIVKGFATDVLDAVDVLSALILLLLIAPHVVLGIAWIIWIRSPFKFQAPKLRTVLLFLALLACSLNIAILWGFAIWLRLHPPNVLGWQVRDQVEGVCDALVVFAILAGLFGKGRAQAPILLAAMSGWAIQTVGHIGIL